LSSTKIVILSEAKHLRSHRPVLAQFQFALKGHDSRGKTRDSYQGIALAIPQTFKISRPFRGWASEFEFFRSSLVVP